MKKYISPEAQLLNFSLVDDVCEVSAVESKGTVVAGGGDDNQDEL